jgi:hypothetical protein
MSEKEGKRVRQMGAKVDACPVGLLRGNAAINFLQSSQN